MNDEQERRLKRLEANQVLTMRGVQALLTHAREDSLAVRFERALDDYEREISMYSNGDERERDTDRAPPDAE